MKNTKSIIVVLFVLLTAQIASAYYCPSTGRWLSRDPIGEPGFQALQKANMISQTGNLTSPSEPSRWINRDSVSEADFAPRQWPDTQRDSGQNLYAFVGNDPIQYVDPFGLRQHLHFKGPYVCQLVKDEDYCPKWKLINHRCTYICVNNIQHPTEMFLEVRPTIFKCSKNIVIWVPYATEN